MALLPRPSSATILVMAYWQALTCALLAVGCLLVTGLAYALDTPWRPWANAAVAFTQAAVLWWTARRHILLTRPPTANWVAAAPPHPAAPRPPRPPPTLYVRGDGATHVARAAKIAESGGAPRSTPEDILQMAKQFDLVAPGSRTVLYVEQVGVLPSRIGILLTTHQFLIIKNHVSDDPELEVYDEPKDFTVTGGMDGAHIILASPSLGAVIDAKNFTIASAARLKDMLGAVRFGIMDPEHDVPPEVRFDQVRPIECYEAIYGPNARQVVQTTRSDNHRFELIFVSDNMRGYLVPRWVIEGPTGDKEVPGFFQPLRTNRQRLTRSARRPFHLEVDGESDPLPILDREGFAYDREQPLIRRRYPKIHPENGLKVLLQGLQTQGLKPGPRGYVLRRGETFDHVTYGGITKSFTKDGRPVTLSYPEETRGVPQAMTLV